MKIFLIVLGTAFLCAASCTAGEILTWSDCVKEARKKHPDLISANEGLIKSRADRDKTRSGQHPQIDTSASARTSGSSGTRSDAYSYSVSGRQLIFDGAKTASRIKSAGESLKATGYSRDVTSSNVRLRLRAAFVGLLRIQELLNITQEIVVRRKRSMELVALRYEAGKEHRGSLRTAEANLAQAEFEVKQAERGIALSRTRLSKELGRRKTSEITAFGKLKINETLPEKPDFESLVDTHPLLSELAARKEIARHNLKAARADFYPSIYANASAGQSGDDWMPDEDSWSAGVSVSYSIFDGRSRELEVRKSRASLRQARANEMSGRDGVLLTLAEAWTDFRNAIDEIDVRNKFLEAAEERARISQAQYSTGLISFDNWIIIEDNLVRARKACLDAQARALNTETRWIQAKGGILEDD